MPRYRFVGESARDYLGPNTMHVEPGQVIEAEDNPDPRRFEKVPSPHPTQHNHQVQED